MTAIEVLGTIREHGGSLGIEGEQLRYSGPPEVLEEVRESLTARKTDVLRLVAHERLHAVLERFARERPRSYSSVPDAETWDQLEDRVDAALRTGTGLDPAITNLERGVLDLFARHKGSTPGAGPSEFGPVRLRGPLPGGWGVEC